jgi:hypothetical protein
MKRSTLYFQLSLIWLVILTGSFAFLWLRYRGVDEPL